MNLKREARYSLFLIRMVVGSVFMLHGAQKLFGLFGGPGLKGFAASLAPQGVSAVLAYSAACCEFIGGTLVFFGIFVELGALLIIPVMLSAMFMVHWPHGYFNQNNGFEYPLNLILLCLAIMSGGPGIYYCWDPLKKI